jgi:cytoskeletal protein CcmA (bactofilin family)
LIFTRKPESVERSSASAHGGGPTARTVSVIGPELVVTGNLETTGDLQIEGDVQGDIYAARLMIGEQARVMGDLVADEIVIGGAVQGSVRGNSVTFQRGCHVEGDVWHRKLTVEQGAYFEGRSRRSEDPTGQHSGNGASR